MRSRLANIDLAEAVGAVVVTNKRGRNFQAKPIGHHAALRQLANRLVGILHGCLKTSTLYDEDTAWQHHHAGNQAAVA